MRALMLALTGLFLAGCVADGGGYHGHWGGPVYRAPPPVYVSPGWRPPPRRFHAAPAWRPPAYHAPRRHPYAYHHRGWHGPRHHHSHRRHHGRWRH